MYTIVPGRPPVGVKVVLVVITLTTQICVSLWFTKGSIDFFPLNPVGMGVLH